MGSIRGRPSDAVDVRKTPCRMFRARPALAFHPDSLVLRALRAKPKPF